MVILETVFDTARVSLEEELSVDKMPPPDRPMVDFLD